MRAVSAMVGEVSGGGRPLGSSIFRCAHDGVGDIAWRITRCIAGQEIWRKPLVGRFSQSPLGQGNRRWAALASENWARHQSLCGAGSSFLV